eukprot:2531956-Amphidinium_carterae.1
MSDVMVAKHWLYKVQRTYILVFNEIAADAYPYMDMDDIKHNPDDFLDECLGSFEKRVTLEDDIADVQTLYYKDYLMMARSLSVL